MSRLAGLDGKFYRVVLALGLNFQSHLRLLS